MPLEREANSNHPRHTETVYPSDIQERRPRPLLRRPSDDSSYASPRSETGNTHDHQPQTWVRSELGTRAIMGEDASPEMDAFQKSCPGDSYSCWQPCCDNGAIEVCRYAAWPGCPSNGYRIVYLRDNAPIDLQVEHDQQDNGEYRSCLCVRPGPCAGVEVGLQFMCNSQLEHTHISNVCIHTNRVFLTNHRAVIQRMGVGLRRQRRNAIDMTRAEMHALMVGNVLQARLNNKIDD